MNLVTTQSNNLEREGLQRRPIRATPRFMESMITLNGERLARADCDTVAALLARLALDPRKVAIERNLAIVPRSAYATTPLLDDDAIEIVGFIGGG